MTIGIIGGGQLGMMLTEAAIELGHKVVALDPNPNASVKHKGATLLNYAFDDKEGIERLNDVCDVVCYEFENIDLNLLKIVASKCPQGMKALEISRDRIVEKQFAQSLGIPTPKFFEVLSETDLHKAWFPSLLKTTRFGYDGKGQVWLNHKDDLLNVSLKQPMILEEIIAFDKEVSVIATRDKQGKVVFYPLVENVHEAGILSVSTPWWDAPGELNSKAYSYVGRILEAVQYVGTLAVEFFLVGEDLIFNEMAPRPHNSGHFSIEGSSVSQFKNMILALTGSEVIEPCVTKPSAMINLLGQHKALINSELKRNVFFHDYFKQSTKRNRKVGHITVLAEHASTLKDEVSALRGEIHEN